MEDQHAVWERIAPTFHATRERTWPHVVSFIEDLPVGRVLDLMCGNGRHLAVSIAAGHDAIGLDFSRPLCHYSARHAPAVAGDATQLPFADATFDACTYVAGLHGIPDVLGRQRSLLELARVLKPGATAQITVWARQAPRFASADLPEGATDVIVPWRAAGLDAQRTYHLYTESSLRAACVDAGLVVDDVAAVRIAADAPDNLVATVRRPVGSAGQ